jgi:non-lysosomal glucosylceramidase
MRRAFLAFLLAAVSISSGHGQSQPIPTAAWSTEIGVSLPDPGHEMRRATTGFDDGYHQGAPVGGIGAGTFSRSDRGDFNRWHLKPGSHTAQTVYADQFAVFEQEDGSEPVAQALMAGHPEGRLTSWKWDYPAGAGRYAALYPKAWWQYTWDKLPLPVTLEQFSPILPGDYRTSGLPVAVYRLHIQNTKRKRVKVSLLLSWENMAGWFRQLNAPLDEALSESNTNHFESTVLPSGRRMAGIVFDQRRTGQAQEEWQGQFAIAAEESAGVEVTYQATFNPSGSGSEVWGPFSTTGRLSNSKQSWVSTGQPEAGAICVSVLLEPGETRVIPMVLAWDFPVVQFAGGRRWLRHYTREFGTSGRSAWSIAADGLQHQEEWSRKIDAWQSGFLNEKPRPDWLSSMMLNELYYLADGGTLWARPAESPSAPDRFALMECFDYSDYASLDVAFYGTFGLLRFFPLLEKTLIREFADTVDQEDNTPYLNVWKSQQQGAPTFRMRKLRGALPHDLGSPKEDPLFLVNEYSWQDSNYWRDLNNNFVLMVWRDYALTGKLDKQFLLSTYPAVKSAMKRLEDLRNPATGLIENGGFPDQTFDEWTATGPSAYCGSLYLAALRAAAEIASASGDPIAHDKYQGEFARAQKAYIDELWTGSYFRYSRGVDDIQAMQLAGQWYASLTGLGSIVPEQMRKSALQTIYAKNVLGFQAGSMGAVNGRKADGSLLEGPQTNEVWTGITFALASEFASEGMKDESLQTAKGVYDTVYQKKGYWFRTPEAWDEKGDFRASMYLRPGAVWAIEYALAP